MSHVKVEKPGRDSKLGPFHLTVHQAELFLGTWYRVAEDDGSTVAYAPDVATAKFIAEKINEERGKK